MKYAITSIEGNLKSKCSSHFGRSEYFAIYDTEDESIEFMKNPFENIPKRAGPSVVKMLSSMNIQIVISTEFGERIKNFFESKKIGMVIVPNENMTIEEIVSKIGTKNKTE
ncbi:MAG: NifB/NifX family molybdenum-iron cluster-binding protein [Bacteroidales bacterium]